MTRWRVFLGTALAVLLARAEGAQTLPSPQTDPQPTFRVQAWSYIDADFSTRVQNYFDLRSRLEEGLPPLRVTEDVSEIRRVRGALAKRIQAARRGAHEGDIFSPAISAEFRRALALEMNATTWDVIMDDNPGEFSHDINGMYPDDKPYSTVPGVILAALPALPDDVEYRFLGRHLILLDIRANVIVDQIPYAIRRADCDHGEPLHGQTWRRDWEQLASESRGLIAPALGTEASSSATARRTVGRPRRGGAGRCPWCFKRPSIAHAAQLTKARLRLLVAVTCQTFDVDIATVDSTGESQQCTDLLAAEANPIAR